VCIEFRKLGHEAYSADIQEPSGGHPEWHIHCDVLNVLNGGEFNTMNGESHNVEKWDLIIAHPPCTYLSNAGACRLYKVIGGKTYIERERFEKGLDGKGFFMSCYNAECEHIAVENPIPSAIYRMPPYTQSIQPYEYGEPYSKKTCLWLKGLPPLMPTDILAYHEPYVNGGCKDAHGNYRRFQGRNERDAKTRAKTFPGIARAMAEQWG
jgi:hypothetical protein